ncbi:MAG: transglutaminase family protein [Dehalococcoidia bacterium]
MERRRGIPITLSLVFMEVAERVGLRCDGVGFPGHFLVRCGEPSQNLYIDPFHGGAPFAGGAARAAREAGIGRRFTRVVPCRGDAAADPAADAQ